MSRNKQRLINLHTATKNNKPAGQLLLGEIAVEHSGVEDAKLYVAMSDNAAAEGIATFITEKAVESKISAEHDELVAVSAQTVNNTTAINQHQQAYEGLLDEVQVIEAQLKDIEATSGAVKTYIDGIKNTIDAYTVNGHAISNNPVLNGADVKLDGYAKASETAAIAATDTVNVALGKLEKAIEDTGGDAISLIEAGNGITVSEKANHKQTVSAKVDSSATEAYLKNGANGLYVEGIDAMVDNDIKTAIEGLDATAGTQTVATGKHVAVEVIEADGKVTAVNIGENDIASDADLKALSGNAHTAIATAKEEAISSAKSYTDSEITSEVTRADGAYAAKTYETKVDNFISTDTSKTARQVAEEERDTAISSASSMDAALKTELIGDMTGETKTLGGLEDRIDAINTGMAVTMATTPTTEGYLKSYIFTQGNTTIGTVDIPKDFLLKSGQIITSGDTKYLDLVINVASGSATDQHVYINVADLCDAYTGDNATIDVSTENVISVKANVFETSGAANEVKTYVDETFATSAQTVTADEAVLAAAKKYADDAIDALDATVGNQTIAEGKHVAVEIVETDGKLTAVTVTENIAGDNVKLANYTSGTSVAAIVASDTVNEALGKLENRVAAAVAGGVSSVVKGDGINVDNTDKNNPVVSVVMTDLVATTASAGVALAVDDNDVKVNVTAGSIAFGNENVVLGGQVYDAIDALDADKTGTTTDGFISVEIHEDAGKITAVSATDKVVAVADASASNKGLAEASDVAAALAKKANTATTLAGYGITDAYTSAQTDSAIATAVGAESARSETAYAKKATTLAGYGITDAYTKAEADETFAKSAHTHTKSDITDFGEYLSASTKYVADAVQVDGDSACTTTLTIKQSGAADSTVVIEHNYVIDCGSY